MSMLPNVTRRRGLSATPAVALCAAALAAIPGAGRPGDEGAVKLTAPIATVLRDGEPCFYAARPEAFAQWGAARIVGLRVVETQPAADANAEALPAKAPRRASFRVRAGTAPQAEDMPTEPRHCLPLARFAGSGPDHITVGAFYSVRVMGRFSDGEVGLFFGNFTVARGFLGALKVQDLNPPAAPR
ncbi:hypothetical protein ACO2Q3_00440 [Caulobacter sp. KR2-114]|uniref:hypothetical protein n=1 Tax=Caulobacter sp. KR2-114 TaxID=3400912 RepID=UPI003C021575